MDDDWRNVLQGAIFVCVGMISMITNGIYLFRHYNTRHRRVSFLTVFFRHVAFVNGAVIAASNFIQILCFESACVMAASHLDFLFSVIGVASIHYCTYDTSRNIFLLTKAGTPPSPLVYYIIDTLYVLGWFTAFTLIVIYRSGRFIIVYSVTQIFVFATATVFLILYSHSILEATNSNPIIKELFANQIRRFHRFCRLLAIATTGVMFFSLFSIILSLLLGMNRYDFTQARAKEFVFRPFLIPVCLFLYLITTYTDFGNEEDASQSVEFTAPAAIVCSKERDPSIPSER
eukprot:TRINITY_DN15066_c0_g1_i2.p1 TRINITY_DN15066_c0_g1~~TRINITY_DN15066_c0_g1_i2.p1  ORF type:complete len:289 (+),score=33.81 TRINITY_DN15066_c0_g1_i2:102-968(+)